MIFFDIPNSLTQYIACYITKLCHLCMMWYYHSYLTMNQKNIFFRVGNKTCIITGKFYLTFSDNQGITYPIQYM